MKFIRKNWPMVFVIPFAAGVEFYILTFSAGFSNGYPTFIWSRFFMLSVLGNAFLFLLIAGISDSIVKRTGVKLNPFMMIVGSWIVSLIHFYFIYTLNN